MRERVRQAIAGPVAEAEKLLADLQDADADTRLSILWGPKTRVTESAASLSGFRGLTGRVGAGDGSSSGCGSLVSLLVAAAAARARRAPASLRAGEGDRDPAAAPPASRSGASCR